MCSINELLRQTKGMKSDHSINAEIISVGTELLLGQIIDTHAPTMAKILADCGIGCLRRTTIGDNLERLVSALTESLSRSEIVITIGGLGPTNDDLTRDAVAAALNDELVFEEKFAADLKYYFENKGLKFADSNLKQAYRPSCATQIDNPNGTAPGLCCRKVGKIVIALPGPPGEFNPMADGPVRNILRGTYAQKEQSQVIHSRTLRIVGIGESQVEKQVKSLMNGENPTLAPYAHIGEVHLRITAKSSSIKQADLLIDPVDDKIRKILGNAVYGIDDTNLESAVVQLLQQSNSTIAVAESMTGGSLGARITSVPGSSAVFLGGVIAYSIPAKVEILGLNAKLISDNGSVSQEVALEMANCVRRKFNTTFGVGITGNAGPGSDVDPDPKPVGLTFVAISSASSTRVETVSFRGIREDIRQRATQLALRLIREQLI